MLHNITSYITTIPPIVIVVLIGLVYAYVAGGNWQWAMLPDVGLAGIYLWRPSLAMLAFALFLGVARHTPALAREIAVMFKLDTFDGWTVRLVVFAFPGLHVYTNAPAQARRESLPPMVGPTMMLPAQPEPVSTMRDLALPELLTALNNDSTAPHSAFIGATRLGKTTLVGVVLSYRQGELVITTPKGEKYDPWFGFPATRTTMNLAASAVDWTPIEQAIGNVHYEMLRRNASNSGESSPITLVIDELTATIAQLPTIAQKIIDLLTMGAGCGIRLVLIATDVNVKGWRMEGRRDVLDNLVFAKVEAGRKWALGKLDANWKLIAPRGMDTSQVHGLAERVSLAGRAWAGLSRAVGAGGRDDAGQGAGGLLGALLGAGVPAGVGVPGVAGGVTPPDPGVQTNKQTQTNGQTEAESRIALYRTWRAAGIKRDQARLIRQGSGDGLDDSEWAAAGKP